MVVPFYKAAPYLGAALDSLLEDSWDGLEVIAVDDGSTDGGADIARERPVRLVSRPHTGISAARNAGIRAAQAQLVAFLDADDLAVAGTLRERAEHLLVHPELDFVLGHLTFFADPRSPPARRPPPGWLGRPHPGGPLTTFVGRRRLFDDVGLFDERFIMGEDVDWLARLKDTGATGAILDHVGLRARLHAGSTTATHQSDVRPTLLRALRESVARQRAGTADAP